MNALSRNLAIESPRLSPRPVPASAYLIAFAGALLFVLLTAQAFFRAGLAGWSVGLAYILYDSALLAFTGRKIGALTRPQPTPMATVDPPPTLGAIIAAHNEAGVLKITIDHLLGQDRPPETILIADDGSTDETAAVLESLYRLAPPPVGVMSDPAPGEPRLRWLRLPHGGKARALNQAMLWLDTDLVMTIDADTLVDPGALGAMRAAFAGDPHLVAATGVLTPICGPSLKGRFFEWFQRYEYVRNFLSRYAWGRVNSLLLVSGAFGAYRREALLAVGGFDPLCLVEDYELTHRLHRHSADGGLGWRVAVVGEATARTDAPASLIGFLKQRRRWFGGYLQTQFWNRDMIGNPHFGALGRAHMPVKTLDTLQPIYGITAFGVLLTLLVTGRLFVASAVLAVMLAKVALDLGYHLWSIHLYRRWTGKHEGLGLGAAMLASLLEPFTFQLLRHIGALWGWHAFLTGRETWGWQQRTAIGVEVGR
ncbi:MAG: glycosyltransferase family 2 protein [Sphingomonas sp.]|uniref:glycosyltransferase family 2 protein n=1 Tax=Sphingomonas sp. TaxID=28214 RepID=UPI0025EE35FE|nr:glycosyltransferase [Sphingomonas sp.]MBX9880444.1 glycosyltransferase family 2 protein [Sphingomonas sp.]